MIKASSAIQTVTYERNTLVVKFKGGNRVYRYPCTPQEFATFHRVNSPGAYFNKVFAGRQFERLTTPTRLVRSGQNVRQLSRVFNSLTGL